MHKKYTFVLATKNARKAADVEHLLYEVLQLRQTHAVKLILSNQAIPDVEETEWTYAGNAMLKAMEVSKYFPGELVVGEDSGLEVDCLGGAPGVLSARYADTDHDSDANNDKLVCELQGQASSDRTARIVCCLAVVKDGVLLKVITAFCEGSVIETPRGTLGFGYDPHFVPDGELRTFAEMPLTTIQHYSHRAKAFTKLVHWMNTYIN